MPSRLLRPGYSFCGVESAKAPVQSNLLRLSNTRSASMMRSHNERKPQFSRAETARPYMLRR